MNEILVKLYIPILEKQYDVLIPSHKRIYNVISSLVKAVNELSNNCYTPSSTPLLYDKFTGKPYDINLSIKESTIRNGSEIILL